MANRYSISMLSKCININYTANLVLLTNEARLKMLDTMSSHTLIYLDVISFCSTCYYMSII